MLLHYIQAFKQFSGAVEGDFQHKAEEWGVYFLWKNNSYRVSHYNDIKNTYRSFFHNRSYDEIHLHTHYRLWDRLFQNRQLPFDTIALELYCQWKVCWNKKSHSAIAREDSLARRRHYSREDLQVLLLLLKENPAKAVYYAQQINEPELVPLLAFVLWELCHNQEAFLDECMNLLLANGRELLSVNDTFAIEYIPRQTEPLPFLIYCDLLEYDDLVNDDSFICEN